MDPKGRIRKSPGQERLPGKVKSTPAPGRRTEFFWEPQIGNLRVHPGHRSFVSFVSFCSFLLCRRPGAGSEQKETKETKSPDAAAPVGSVSVYGFPESLNAKRRCKQVKFCCGCINGLGQRSFE